ncbi:helix-turn-helix transcriptional regulator [Morganella morganii subsp. morganii]|nr:helix-turn-helix transcriptional regulator [Morganella morganii subsp. morganii]
MRFSGFIGVSQQQISRYERGETELPLGKLQKRGSSEFCVTLI